MRALAAALWLLAAPAAAQFGDSPATVAGAAVDPTDAQQLEEMRRQLASDPAVARALLERIMRSRLGDRFSAETESGKRAAEIAEWIRADPEAAAQVAVGLARDDAEGSDRYESALLRNTRTRLDFNPQSRRGVLGRLKKASDESRLLRHQDNEGLAEEEKRELLKTLFEGQGSQDGRVLTMEKDGTARPSEGRSAPAPALADGYYDRLSAANLRGYSPQLMALQSALNRGRPPGAPALIETGKLDHPTLAFPAHAMRWDLENLEKRFRRSRLEALAAMRGHRLSERELDDPLIAGGLFALAGAWKLPPRFAKREEAMAKARAALAAFLAKADESRDPARVTRELLRELGRLQRDGARWIAIAALEEELSRVEAEEGFLTPELLAAIEAAPVLPDARAAYRRRGESYRKRLLLLKQNANHALDILRTDAWEAQAAKAERLIAENRLLRRELSRDVADYSKVPFRIAESRVVQARWRVWAEDLTIKWLPGSPFARQAAHRRGRLSRYVGVFLKIASGDLPDARRTLAAAEAQ